MDVEHNLKEATKLRKIFQDKVKQQYHSRSGERLNKSIERKFRTTFIGSLSSFEEAFGHIWRNREPEELLTPEELKNRRLWEQVRTNVLNNGNNQLRAAQSEIAEYTVEWNRHQTNIPVKEIKEVK